MRSGLERNQIVKSWS